MKRQSNRCRTRARCTSRGRVATFLCRCARSFSLTRRPRSAPRKTHPSSSMTPPARIRAGGVIDEDGWVFLGAERGRRVRLNDLAHRHKKVATRPLDVHLARVRHRFDCRFINARCLGNKLWIGVHGAPLTHRPQGSEGPAVQRFPAAALSASGSKGLLSPGQASSPGQDPYVALRNLTPSGGGLASVSAARAYCECDPYAVTLALATVARVRGKRSN